MIRHVKFIWEGGLPAKFAAVGLIGFATDASLLHLGLALGLHADWARAVSLVCAMQATFLVNGLMVFRCLERSRLLGQWAGYMAANGLGNLCNYLLFLTLVSTHWRIGGDPLFALTVGSAFAWAINYTGTRLLVFARGADDLAVVAAQARDRFCGEDSTKA